MSVKGNVKNSLLRKRRLPWKILMLKPVESDKVVAETEKS